MWLLVLRKFLVCCRVCCRNWCWMYNWLVLVRMLRILMNWFGLVCVC